jgi:hypothetical protein
VRNHEEVQIGTPRFRQVIGALVLLTAALVLFGVAPFGPVTVGVALLLVGAGLLV